MTKKSGVVKKGDTKVEAQPEECVEHDHYSDSLPKPLEKRAFLFLKQQPPSVKKGN